MLVHYACIRTKTRLRSRHADRTELPMLARDEIRQKKNEHRYHALLRRTRRKFLGGSFGVSGTPPQKPLVVKLGRGFVRFEQERGRGVGCQLLTDLT